MVGNLDRMNGWVSIYQQDSLVGWVSLMNQHDSLVGWISLMNQQVSLVGWVSSMNQKVSSVSLVSFFWLGIRIV